MLDQYPAFESLTTSQNPMRPARLLDRVWDEIEIARDYHEYGIEHPIEKSSEYFRDLIFGYLEKRERNVEEALLCKDHHLLRLCASSLLAHVYAPALYGFEENEIYRSAYQRELYTATTMVLGNVIETYKTHQDSTKVHNLLGLIQEITPLAMLTCDVDGQWSAMLGSRHNDTNNKTDLYFWVPHETRHLLLPVQVKQSLGGKTVTQVRPPNGIFIRASDYGNSALEVSSALATHDTDDPGTCNRDPVCEDAITLLRHTTIRQIKNIPPEERVFLFSQVA